MPILEKKPEKVNVSLSLDDDVLEWVDTEANKIDYKRSEFINDLLRKIKDEKK